MPPKNETFVRDEIEKMFNAVTVTLCSRLVVPGSNYDEEGREARLLRRLPHHELDDEGKKFSYYCETCDPRRFVSSNVLHVLDFFTRCLQIWMHEDFKEKTTFVCRYRSFQF